MKKLLLFNVFLLSLFTAFGQVTKTDATAQTLDASIATRNLVFTAADFPGCGSLTEVELDLTLTVTDNSGCVAGGYGVHNDIAVSLQSPSGTIVHLVQDFSGILIGSPPPQITYQDAGFPTIVNETATYDDDAALLADNQTSFGVGTWKPHNPLSAFDGENPVGVWTLRVADGRNQFGADFTCYLNSGLRVTCGPACTEPTIPTITASTNPICNGGSTTLNIAGTLNDATQWHVYTGFCGITPVGTTTGTTFAVSPTSNTSYFIRGEGGCATPGTCGAITINVNPTEDASFSYGPTSYCVDDGDPTPTISGVAGGTFSSTAGLILNATDGQIDLSASTPGTYTVTYTTSGTCPGTATQNITINAIDDASFSYANSAYCANDSDPTPTITGLLGGSFSSAPGGLSINASTGAIDVSISSPGAYTVTYTTAGQCLNSSNVSVTVNAVDNASFSYSAGGYCTDDSDPTPTITGLVGGSFSAGPGLLINAGTGVIDLSASTPGAYTVTYTTTGTCPNSSSVGVTVNALDDASFAYSAGVYCSNDSDPTPTITGLLGGTFSSGAGLSINASTGAIDLSISLPGTYTVAYLTSGLCPNSSSVSVTVNAVDDASFSYSASSYCSAATDPTPTVTGLAGGTFTSTIGLSINASTGEVDLSLSTPGTYTITYTTAGTCPNSSSVSLTVTALDDASFSYSAAAYCVNGSNPTATITGVAGGAFSSTAGLVFVSTVTGEIDLAASAPGAYTVTYTTVGACSNSSAQIVTVNALPTAPTPVTPTTVCPGDDVILSATGSGTGSIVFYDNAMTQLGSVAMPPATATFNAGALGAGTYVFSATEDNGACESSPVTINVTVGDITDPTAVCQDITIFLDGTGTATIVAGDLDGGSTDNCGPVTLSASQTSFDCTDIDGSPAGTLIITGAYDGPLTGGTPKGVELYVSNDIADLSQYGIGSANNGGGTDGEEFTFPAVSVTAGTYIYVASEATQFTNFFGFAPDYTDGSMGINGDDAVELFHMGSVIDVFGDINTDGTGEPWDFLDGWAYRNSATGPDGSTFALGSWSFSGINVYDGQTTNATTPTPLPLGTFAPASSGATSVTLTVTDAAGNTAMCTANVTVSDTVSPIASCQDVTVFLNGSGVASIVAADIDSGSSDNCGVASITASPTDFTCADAGPIAVTLTVTDASGNTSTCTSTVTVADSTSPTAVCQDISVFLDGSGFASITAADIDGGSSDNCGTVTLSATPTAFTCGVVGSNTVTLIVTDGSGNTSTCTAIVTVSDSTSPVVICPGDQTEIASANCDFVLLDYTSMASGSDACGSVTLTQSPALGTVITSDQVVTITGVDINGNTSTCTFNVLLDLSACAGTECTNAIAVGPHDPCGETTVESGSTVGGTTSTETSFCGTSAGSGGANWYTFTGDGAAWTASTLNPGSNYDTKLWVYDGLCGSLNCVTGNDDFGGTSRSQVSFATTVGTTYYVVVGGFSANEGNYELTLTSVEAIAPVPDAATLADVTGVCEVTSLTDPTATDNCSATVTVTNDATFPITTQGTTVVTWTYEDGNGNTATQTQNVILTDVTAPVADLATLADVTAECEVTSLTDPTATDNCNGTVTVTNDATLPISSQGTTLVTWTYTDEAGNSSTQTQNVVLTDVTAPVADAATLADVTAECEVTTLVDPTATDNCSGTVTVTNDATLPISSQGTTVVTWTYDDGNGNSSTQTQNVVITDVSSPIPTAAPLPDLTGECSVDLMPTAPTAVDACAGAITGVEISGTAFPVIDQGTTVLVWEFDDGNGNITTQTQNIVVNDVTGPTPDAGTLADLTGDCSIDTPTAPTATDNCSGAITGTTTTTFPITAIGTTVIVWEFDDGNGNITTQTQDAINSGVDASATLSADGVTITANTAGATYEWINCDFNTVIVGESGQSFTPSANGNYAVTVTVGGCSATSACENISSVGIDALAIDQLSVYPNPSESGFFTVSYEGTIESIDVVDMLGRVIVLPTDLTTGLVDGSELAYGRYMVRVTTDKSVLTTEIVITK